MPHTHDCDIASPIQIKKKKKVKKKYTKKTEIQRKSGMKPSQPVSIKAPVYSQNENRRKFMIDKIKSLPGNF